MAHELVKITEHDELAEVVEDDPVVVELACVVGVEVELVVEMVVLVLEEATVEVEVVAEAVVLVAGSPLQAS